MADRWFRKALDADASLRNEYLQLVETNALQPAEWNYVYTQYHYKAQENDLHSILKCAELLRTGMTNRDDIQTEADHYIHACGLLYQRFQDPQQVEDLLMNCFDRMNALGMADTVRRYAQTAEYDWLAIAALNSLQKNGNAETDNLYDAYYYHSHEGTGDGHGCVRVRDGNGNISHYGFSCVLKLVPLNRNGSPKKISGKADGVLLLSMRGGIRGVFGSQIERVRIFDSVTHSQLVDITNTARDKNPGINGKFYDSRNSDLISVRNNSPFYKAMHMTSGCPIKPWNLP